MCSVKRKRFAPAAQRRARQVVSHTPSHPATSHIGQCSRCSTYYTTKRTIPADKPELCDDCLAYTIKFGL